jgi:hypothetical protein
MSKVLKTLLANVKDDEKVELYPSRLAKEFVAYICTRENDRMYAKHVWVPKAEGIDGLTIAMREAWKEIALCIANDAENDARAKVEEAKKKNA